MVHTELKNKQKLHGNYFYLPCDTLFFNEFAKYFVQSARQNSAEINIHCHIFDPLDADLQYCDLHKISLSYERTPTEYDSLDKKKGYWVNIRFVRIPEIFDDSASIMAVDPDGVIVNKITLAEFKQDTSVDSVAMREKGYGALGGYQSFAPNGSARHILKERILNESSKRGYAWFMDQEILNEMVKNKEINTTGMKYVDYHCRQQSKIWTGKGARKYIRKGAKPGKNKFANKMQEFKPSA